MHGLTVGEKYNTQIAAVALYLLPRWMRYNALDPLKANNGAVGTLTHRLEVARESHPRNLAQAWLTGKAAV